MYKKHKFIKNIKKAWYKIKLIDRCLIIVMAILMFQSIYNLFVNEVNSQDTTTIDVVVRTTSAAIFGYFLSANFIKRPLRKYTNTDVSSNLFIDNNLSPKGQESNQNNIMNVKNTIGFTSEADNYEKKIPINNNEGFEEGETSEFANYYSYCNLHSSINSTFCCKKFYNYNISFFRYYFTDERFCLRMRGFFARLSK